MAEYLTTDTELTSIANAIRTRGGTSAALTYPEGFITAIENIPSGGGSPVIITDTTDEHGGTIRHISTTGSTLDGKSADDVVISGTTVTVPAGIYAIDAVKTITGVTLTAPSSGTKTFSITVPNGNTTATFVFNVDSSGNVTITES